jgi:FG-GAP-like repeat
VITTARSLFCLATACLLAALSVLAGGAEPGTAAQALTFERQIAPFPVLDETGRPYALPFLGGLDVPRPQFVDIDGDRDLDLFVQEYSNAIWFFENTGTAAVPRYEWRSDRYLNLEIGEWYRFVDLDADGDYDLLSEQPFSNIRWYRNTGSRTAPAFEAAGALQDSDSQPILFDRQNIPAIVDLDCDNRLDLFIGRVEGTVTRYEAEAPGAARFSFITDRFEDIEIIGGVGLADEPRSGPRDGRATARHGANALAFADFDGDKDLDLFWGDFFEAGVLLIENVGRTCSSPSFQVDPVALPHVTTSARTSGYNTPVPIDLDLDGDLDFLMGVIGGSFNPVATSADNFYYWERVAAARLELRTKRFLAGVDLGSETIPALVDLDGDRDLDLVIGNKIDPAQGGAGRLTVFENQGTATAPAFRWRESLRLVEAFHIAPAFGDLDADGDPDLLVGTWNQDVRYFRNQGTAREAKWVEDEAAAIRPPRVSSATPALADIDGDKDLDLFIGQATGALAFYRNDGTPKSPRFVLVSDRQDDLRAGRRSVPALVDLTRDGLLDLLAGRETGGLAAYRNAGSRSAPRFTEMPDFTLPLPTMSAPTIADLDGDGKLDVVSGTVSGGLIFLRGR